LPNWAIWLNNLHKTTKRTPKGVRFFMK